MPRSAKTTRPARTVPMLTDDEEAALQAAIADDPDAREATDAELAQMRPAREALPPALYAALTKRGRPKAEAKAVQVTLRVPPDVLDAFKASGPGWQTRMNEALAKAAKKLRAA
ncbi:BrnA antitoxin family protein [Methylobacterium aerolatum]|uniref:Uncharacterized protein (DUF4415 family) n=1 Tax=Methylobacterium aerolatum TaxID=418708 RepID=A0ABU0I2M2_9HYPH|nr:BrnA antitoxin family protein [Methylobacterium aerolatum]MDQ0448845.1 uncharacterized protein (DUF4415 family) [Methylobacterium aerolatum]GJD34209.1 hypothetical protein FMGBMHLM_1105 [Methylobacterium aerolatum]